MEVEITGFDFEGRGVARINGKTVFVAGALPTERVKVKILKDKKQFTEAIATDIITPAAARIQPRCQYFSDCGGCSLQHIDFHEQVSLKEQVFLEQLARIGKVIPQKVLPALPGEPWHYRSRARFHWQEKNHALGFLGRKSHQVINLEHCDVLPEQVSQQLPAIRQLCQSLSGIKGVDISLGTEVVVLRILLSQPTQPTEKQQVMKLVTHWNQATPIPWQIWLQVGKRVEKFPAHAPLLAYQLPQFGLVMPFFPDDFTQVNQNINQMMIDLAVQALEIEAGERVIDLFCGLGNFSLPLARQGAQVLGIEGVEEMVNRAKENAAHQGLSENCQFLRADLFAITKKDFKRWGKVKKWLLDPPRAGAQTLCMNIDKPFLPEKIVYISCNPATLARDAKYLTEKGFQLTSARIMNMFAQTTHVESMATFER